LYLESEQESKVNQTVNIQNSYSPNCGQLII
jgi:hypothetical protein